MRNILITNDDGIRSDGLLRLVRSAAAFGQVWVVAPDTQRSAASHSITLDRTIDLFPFDLPVPGVRAFSCTGTPSDCVRLGCLAVLPQKPDVVLSGINFGYNSASDLQYSATAGAALEAAFQGVTGIALSEGASDRHSVTDAYLSEVLERLMDLQPPEGCIWNVNFPDCPLEECRGILTDRKVSGETFYRDHYEEVELLPGGGRRMRVKGILQTDTEEQGTDFRAILDKYVSIGTVRNLS
jgi:5'-nucleotidase